MVEDITAEVQNLPEGVIDLSGNGCVTKKILKEGVGTETPQGLCLLVALFLSIVLFIIIIQLTFIIIFSRRFVDDSIII